MLPQKVIGVYKDNELVLKGTKEEVGNFLQRKPGYVAHSMTQNPYIALNGVVFELRYTGEHIPPIKCPKKKKPCPKPKSTAIKDVVKAAREAGMSYGEYVARYKL